MFLKFSKNHLQEVQRALQMIKQIVQSFVVRHHVAQTGKYFPVSYSKPLFVQISVELIYLFENVFRIHRSSDYGSHTTPSNISIRHFKLLRNSSCFIFQANLNLSKLLCNISISSIEVQHVCTAPSVFAICLIVYEALLAETSIAEIASQTVPNPEFSHIQRVVQ